MKYKIWLVLGFGISAVCYATPSSGTTPHHHKEDPRRICATQAPRVLQSLYQAYLGMSVPLIKNSLRQAYKEDEAAKKYYTQVYEGNSWASIIAERAVRNGKKIKDIAGNTPKSQVRHGILSGKQKYTDICTQELLASSSE